MHIKQIYNPLQRTQKPYFTRKLNKSRNLENPKLSFMPVSTLELFHTEILEAMKTDYIKQTGMEPKNIPTLIGLAMNNL